MSKYIAFCALVICYFGLVESRGKLWDIGRRVRRQAGYQMCLDNFDIYENKIIRTEDSRELGAKYISERDVATRKHCYQLCCDTANCDVFVYEEKRPGSCYLFECGPPNDFKCKFTQHLNYTSGVSKHLSELETQIKFTQHEHELINLREPDKTVSSKQQMQQTVDVKTTVSPAGSKETLQLVPQQSPKHDQKGVEKCNSFYQFECRTSHECIAIYNACDGIPQCADGSDEAAELKCPKQVSGTSVVNGMKPAKAPAATSNPIVDQFKSKDVPDKNISPVVIKSQPEKPPSQLQYATHQSVGLDQGSQIGSQIGSSSNSNGYQSWPPQQQAAESINPRLAYGREGEGLSNPDGQWYGDRVVHQNQPGTNGQIFNHKSNGILPQGDRFPPPQHNNFPDNSMGNTGYNGEQQLPNEYMRYNYFENNPQYRMGPPPQSQYPQPSWPHKLSGDETMMKSDRYPGNGMMPQEFYYDENAFRSRQQVVDNRLPIDANQMVMNVQRVGTQQQAVPHPPPSPPRTSQDNLPPQLTYQNRAHEELTNLAKSNGKVESDSSRRVVADNPPPVVVTTPLPTTQAKPSYVQEEHHRQLSHIKFEKLTADAAFAPSEMDGHNISPSGAILSLTFGLLITAVMVVLVGCRIRTVRRRLRRGGKSFAHDADFLVNGMYL